MRNEYLLSINLDKLNDVFGMHIHPPFHILDNKKISGII